MSDKILKENLYGALRKQGQDLTEALDSSRAVARITAALAVGIPEIDRKVAQERAKKSAAKLARIEKMIGEVEELAEELYTELYDEAPVLIGDLPKLTTCEDCGGSHKGKNGVGLCDTCYEAAELYNSVQDGEMGVQEFKENLRNLNYQGKEFA